MKELKTQSTITNTRNESYTNTVKINIIERCIQNPVKHLRERFVKIAYYCQNASSQMFNRVLNKPLLSFEFQKQPSRGFLRKCVLKKCSKFTGEHPYRSAISIKLQSNFIEITLWHWCSPVNLLHIFRTHFLKSTFGQLLLEFK